MAWLFSIDFLLLFITIPSIPFFGIISNLDLRGCAVPPLTYYSFGTSKEDLFRHDFLAVFDFTATLFLLSG
jgi:hypothetical protein